MRSADPEACVQGKGNMCAGVNVVNVNQRKHGLERAQADEATVRLC